MEIVHKQLFSMGTRLDLVFAGVEENTCNRLVDSIRSECERIEQLLSVYRTDSAISLLNTLGHSGTLELEPEVMDILREIRDYHFQTSGYFDVTLKAASDYYHDPEPGDPMDPDRLRKICGMDKLEISPQGARILEKGLQVDLGGFGKGYAVKQMKSLLQQQGVKHALVSFGESLILGWGSHPYGHAWIIEVATGNEGKPISFELLNEAVAVSGNSLNNRKKFANSGHIVNPRTLQMVRPEGLVCVKSGDPVKCEV
jgi:thiamine biosynthesis lipoprotein